MVAIAHLSDLHFGDACPVALRDARQALDAFKPDCIVVTGDITQAGRRREFDEAAAWFGEFAAPLVVCPGNHDAPVYSVLSRLLRPYGRFARLGLQDQWLDGQGRAAVVAWNSARAFQARADWSQGVHAPAQVDTALRRASSLSPDGWRILACHHPPGAPAAAPIRVRTRHAANTRAALSASPKTILLCGHVHQFSQETVGAAMIVTAPTLASSRQRRNGRGFVTLRLSGESAELQSVTL